MSSVYEKDPANCSIVYHLHRELIELQEEVNVLEREQNHFVANVRTSQHNTFFTL